MSGESPAQIPKWPPHGRRKWKGCETSSKRAATTWIHAGRCRHPRASRRRAASRRPIARLSARSRASALRPARLSSTSTSGRSLARTSPIQVSPAAAPRRARSGGKTRAELVVLAAGRGELGADRARAPARPRATPGASGSAARVELEPHAARLGEAPRVRAPGRRRGRASRARRRAASARALGEPRPRAQVALRRARRRPARGPRARRARPPSAPSVAGDADQVARPRAVAADERRPRARPSRRRSPRSSAPGRAARSPPAIVVPHSRASASAPAVQREHVVVAERRRQHDDR